MPPVTTVIVSKAESGQKLLQFLDRRISLDGVSIPRGALQRWVRKGHVRVDGKRMKPFDRIEAGQQVRIPPYQAPGDDEAAPETASSGSQPPQQHAAPMARPLDIVHESDELLVLSKPAGLPAHGGTGHDDSMADRLAVRYAGASFRPSLVHRLDKNTSGLLLAAKTYTALRRLNEIVASGGMGKFYLAWVHGQWTHEAPVLLEDTLEKQGEPGKEKMATGSGKAARCRVFPVQATPRRSLVAIQLLTGRTHQIRVQLASRGHAIIGDGKYGDAKPPQERGTTGMLLHAYRLEVEGRRFLLPPDWPAPFAVSEQILHSLHS